MGAARMNTRIGSGRPRAVLVHISDIHLRGGEEGREERNAFLRAKLIQDLGAVMSENQLGPATAVLVTGDIAFGGKKPEFDLARDWLREVCEVVDADPTRMLCVPGNHDVDRDKIGATHLAHRLAIAHSAPHELDHLIDLYLAEADQAILTPLAAYSDFAAGSDCQFTGRLHWDIPLPLGDRYYLAFRGATSVLNSGPDDDQAGSLAMHKNQLLMHTRAGQVNVFLSHHDPYFWSRHALIPQPPAAGASIALYGHTHTPRASKVDECIEITAGAVQPDEGADWNPTYNVIEVEVEEQEDRDDAQLHVRVWRRRFSDEVGEFVADARGSEMLTFAVRIPAAAPVRGDGDDVAPDTATTEQDEELPDEAEEVRAALSTNEGKPVPLREVMLALSNMGAGSRSRLLADLDLLDDTLASLPQRQQIPAASQAIVDAGKTDEFRAALQRLERAD
jgi:hypothetical protein